MPTELQKGMLATLGNEQWLRKNEASIKEVLPKSWTHMQNLKPLPISFRLKLLGVPWKTDNDFGGVMVVLERLGILQRDKLLFKANPHSIFKLH